jgi:hypothetical protein
VTTTTSAADLLAGAREALAGVAGAIRARRFVDAAEDPRRAVGAARLLQAYELQFWDTLVEVQG